MTTNGNPFGSLGKENDSFSSMFGESLRMTPQQVEKKRASDARAKVLRERAEKLHVDEDDQRKSGSLLSEEQIRRSVERDRRKSRERMEKLQSLSPGKKFDPSSETSWSQMLKWIPFNPNTSTFLDRDGYAVPNTLGPFTNSGLRTPERMKSPDELFFTPAARLSGRFSSPYRNVSGNDDSLIGRLGADFERKLSLEATKIGLMARKTIQGLEEIKKLDDGDEKTWRSPLKKCNLKMPEFSSTRQSHPLTKDCSDFRAFLPGAVGHPSDDETTLDEVSPLNSEATSTPKRSSTTPKAVSSKLPKILGAQLQAEINYALANNSLEEKLEEAEELLNSAKKLGKEEVNLSSMLDNIELFDHSLPVVCLTPKNRYKSRVSQLGNETASPSPRSLGRKMVSFLEVDRDRLLDEFDKLLTECVLTMKRFIGQQEKIHKLVDEEHTGDESYRRTMHNFYEDLKRQLQEKKVEAKEKSASRHISETDFLAWMKQEKEKIDNQTKFFMFVWVDQGKFIRKHHIQPPQAVNLSTEAAVEPATIEVPPTPPNSTTEYLSRVQSTQVDSEPKTDSGMSPGKKKSEWEVSVRDTMTPPPLDEVFVGEVNSSQQEEQVKSMNWDDVELKEPEESNSFASLVDSDEREPEVSKLLEESLPRDESPPLSCLSTPRLPAETVPEEKVAEIETVVTNPVDALSESTEKNLSSSSSSTVQLSEEESTEPSPSSTDPLRYPRSPRGHPTVPPLELSLLHSSGRVSIDASSLFEDEEELDDFLNRSGRKEPPQRYKLDASLLNETAPSDENIPERSSPKKEFVNEPYPKTSPQMEANMNQQRNRPEYTAIDLNLTEEEEGLEDVRKPEPMLDFTISKAVTEYEKKLASEEDKWDEFVELIRNPHKRGAMLEECIEIVWNIKESSGCIPLDRKNNWQQFVADYGAAGKFEDPNRQEMFASEWIGMLGDVFEIAGDLFPQEERHNYRSTYYPLSPSLLNKEKFSKVCTDHLLEKKRGSFVEQTTREYQWDLDPARRNAYEMVYEEHPHYLRQELSEAIEAGVRRGVFETSDLFLRTTVDSILEEGRRSLEKK